MKKETVTTLLLIGGAAGLYYLLSNRDKAALDDTDLRMMEQIERMQIASQLQQQELMKIIAAAKQSSDKDQAMNPWTHPNTVFQAAKIGIDLIGIL